MRAHHRTLLHRIAGGTAVAAGLTLFVISCTDHELPPTAPVLTPVTTTASVSADSALLYRKEQAKSKAKQESVMGSISATPAMRTANAAVDLDALRRTFTALHKTRVRGKELDYSLSLKALDAMAAPTPEERRRILAELPIELEKIAVGTDAAGRQIIRTRVIVRGVVKKVYDRVVGSRTDDTPDVIGISGPLEGDESLGENSIPVAVELYCPEDTEDCISEPEAEDLEIEWAAIESDAADTDAAVNADFNACVWVNEECLQAEPFLPLEGYVNVGLEGCDTSLSDLPAEADLGARAGCWYTGLYMVAACGASAVAVGAVGAAIVARSWRLFLAAAGSAILANDECVDSINEWQECLASDDAASFGGWLHKQETIRIGAHS